MRWKNLWVLLPVSCFFSNFHSCSCIPSIHWFRICEFPSSVSWFSMATMNESRVNILTDQLIKSSWNFVIPKRDTDVRIKSVGLVMLTSVTPVYHVLLFKRKPGWWFQAIWTICSSVKIKNLWNHQHLEKQRKHQFFHQFFPRTGSSVGWAKRNSSVFLIFVTPVTPPENEHDWLENRHVFP